MNPTDTKQAQMLDKVRKLIAKAESTDEPGEAEVFFAKANELMTAYAIQQWMVDEGAETGRPQPEVRQMDFSWWRSASDQHRDAIWGLFYDVARHCRCAVALRGWGDRKQGGSHATMPVIGLPSDLDYMDMLFTSLMLQMVRQLHPQVDTRETLGENAYRMRSAGMPMREGRDAMAPLLWRAGLLDLAPTQASRWPHVVAQPGTEQTAWRQLPQLLVKSLVGRVRRALNDEVAKRGPYPKVHPRVYQRSFADGFVDEVSSRFRRMRSREEQQYGTTGSMALALVDIRQQALNLYEDLWPTPEDTGAKRKGRAVSREVRYSHTAYSHGTDAGAKADISGHPGKGLGGRKGLPGGDA